MICCGVRIAIDRELELIRAQARATSLSPQFL
jgi:hypothetical protein